MALVLADRVKETTTTTGTGTVTLLGAATGFQSFSAVGNGNTTYYCIAGQGTAEWEVGIGTYTSAGTTLSRTTVLASSNAGSLVTFSAGTKDVFVTYPSSRSVYADGTTLQATNSSILPVASGGTGNTTAQAEMNRVAGAVTSGQYLRGNGTNVVMSAIQAADVPTLNQNTTGTATNATNVAITNDTSTATSQYITFVAASSGNTGVKTHSTGLTFVPSTGAFTASGNVTAYSDERLKQDWSVLAPDFVERLAAVKSGTYTRIDNEERQAGSSAQDWQKLLPEVVQANDEGILSLAYGNAALVSAVELAKRVVDQEARIAKLEAMVAQFMKGNTP